MYRFVQNFKLASRINIFESLMKLTIKFFQSPEILCTHIWNFHLGEVPAEESSRGEAYSFFHTKYFPRKNQLLHWDWFMSHYFYVLKTDHLSLLGCYRDDALKNKMPFAPDHDRQNGVIVPVSERSCGNGCLPQSYEDSPSNYLKSLRNSRQ